MSTSTCFKPFSLLASALIRYAQRRPYTHLRHRDGAAYMQRYWLMPKCLLRQRWRTEEALGPRLHADDRVRPPLVRRQVEFYELRWRWLPSIRIHHIVSSDADRELHDHPWSSMSLILRGRYIEVTPCHPGQHPSFDQVPGGVWRSIRNPGKFIFRAAEDRHRLIVLDGEECWSLFAMGSKVREWGFHTPTRWVPSRQYDGSNEVMA